ALEPRVVVKDAEHAPAVEAIARQGRIPVDPLRAVGAADHELPHLAVTAAVPGALHDAADLVVLVRPVLAKPRPRGAGEKLAVRRAQPVARAVHSPALGVDRAAEIVDRMSVARPQRKAVLVDARETERVGARPGRPDVSAEVKRLAS